MKLFGLKPERQMAPQIITDFPRKVLQKEKLIWVEKRENQPQKELGCPGHLGFHISIGRANVVIVEIHSNHCLHYSNSTDCTQKCCDVRRLACIPLALTWVGQWHSPCKATYASIPTPSPSCPILCMIILHPGRNTGWESGSKNIRVRSFISPLNKLLRPCE